MEAGPETDLHALLIGMCPRLHDEPLVFATVPAGSAPPAGRVVVRVEEDEGTTLVMPETDAGPRVRSDFRCARITLEVASSLAAVGFLATVTRALADAGISANPVSGFHHDHVFVPYDERHRALAVLAELAAGGDRTG